MHLSEKIDNIISQINQYNKDSMQLSQLIKDICDVFDLALKVEKISENLLTILYYFSNVIGIPQYFDLFCELKNVDNNIPLTNQLLLNSMISESNLYIDKENKVHIFQKELLSKFEKGKLNRFLISASTSFGKTYIIYSILKKMLYQNIVLIFPTVSLLSENLERFIGISSNNYFKDFNIVTLSEETLKDKNILIFTPERFMTFIDKNPTANFDFVFIDEIYKIDNDFLNLDVYDELQDIKDKDRDLAFRIALELSVNRAKDMLLAGPFLDFSSSNTMKNFIEDNNFVVLDYNSYDLVKRNQVLYKELKNTTFDGIEFDNIFSKNNNTEKLYSILSKVSNEQSIVYCSTKYLAEDYALKLSERKIFNVEINHRYIKLLKHLENEFGDNWCLVKALKEGIGIHHGTIPKYIQKEIIKLYNEGIIKCIFSTTTITEGVNTTAKNMIILSNKKGQENLKKFDILNIIGRAGRFRKHFSGRIFIIESNTKEILQSQEDVLSHRNYSIETRKSEVDLEFTRDKYLSTDDKINKKIISEKYDENNIPEVIRKSFLMISYEEKISLYKIISKIINDDEDFFNRIIKSFNSRHASLVQIQCLINILQKSISQEDKLFSYFEKGKYEYSRITYMLNSYLIGGYKNMLFYRLQKGEKIDTAIRETSKNVYNIFRYELVKHISVMDLIYRTIYADLLKINIDDVVGFNSLLSFLEYGAYTEKGRKVSDFGVPFRVLQFIENNTIELDDYEKIIYDEVEKVIKY